MDMLQPTLVTGLTELCRARPEQSEAVVWLANWCEITRAVAYIAPCLQLHLQLLGIALRKLIYLLSFLLRLKANNPYLPKKYNEWEVLYNTAEPEAL